MKRPIIRPIRQIPGRGLVTLGLLLLASAFVLRAQDAPEAEEGQNSKLTPYETALLNYKSGNYEIASPAIDEAEKANPGDPATEILKARILTELGKYDEANKILNGLSGSTRMTPALIDAQDLAFGDLCLRKKSFAEAVKFYEPLLARKPGNPDLMLKDIYARIGANDLVYAAKVASQLKPLDQDHPCYYFAKAALAQVQGRTDEAEQNIETSRTIYGISMTNRYLKTYYEVFAAPDKTSSTTGALTPGASTNAAPANP